MEQSRLNAYTLYEYFDTLAAQLCQNSAFTLLVQMSSLHVRRCSDCNLSNGIIGVVKST